MAVQRFDAATALFKRVYWPGTIDMLHEDTPGLSLLKKSPKNLWSGSAIYMNARTGRNRSYRPTDGETNEAAAMPTTGRQAYSNWVVGCVMIHGSGGVTAFGEAASKSSVGAYEDMLKKELQGVSVDVQKDLEIDFFGTELGILARVNGEPGAGANPVVTLDQAQSLVAWDAYGNKLFSPNMLVDFVNQANGAINVAGATVGSVASANRTQITMAAAAGLDAILDNDLVVRAGTLTDTGDDTTNPGFAFCGLESGLFNPNVATLPAVGVAAQFELDILQGINRNTAGNEFAHATVIDKANAALLRSDLNNLAARIGHRGQAYPDYFLCHDSVQFAIADLMADSQRYQPQEFPGGFKSTSLLWNAGYKDIPIIVARECPYDTLYALEKDSIEFASLVDFELIETDGSVLRQDSGGGDVWNFNWRLFGNMVWRAPNRCGKLVQIGAADEGFGPGAGRLYDF